MKTIYQNGVSVTSSPPYTVIETSTSGAYQCAVTNNGDNVFLAQHTTEVLVVSKYLSSSQFPCSTIFPCAPLYIYKGSGLENSNFTVYSNSNSNSILFFTID